MFARRLIEIALSSIVAATGLFYVVAEGRAIVQTGAPFASGPALGLAPETRLAALHRCDTAMSGPGFGMQAELPRRAIAGACSDLAAGILDDAPSHGFAHLIAATAAATAGDTVSAARHLTASQDFAPFEGWLAERRLLLLAPRIADADTAGLVARDATALLHTETGAALLIGLARTSVPLRDILLDKAERLDPAERRRMFRLAHQSAIP